MASAFERISEALSALGKRARDDSGSTHTTPKSGGAASAGRKRVVFRPWDQKDLHRRLETYRPLTWFAKPDCVGPVACASRGWVNESRDTLCCEFCGVKLLYPQNTPLEARARAAQMFSEQLTSRHEAHCPWRSTRCDDSVLAFNPSAGPAATPGGPQAAFLARLKRLERIDMLPDVYARALQHLARQAMSSVMCVSPDRPHRDRRWGPDSLCRVLALPPPPAAPPRSDDGMPPAFDPASPIVLPCKLTMGQKARLLALLGWDAEELPPGSVDRPRHAASIYRPSTGVYSLSHLVGAPPPPAPTARPEQGAGADESAAQWSMDNVVLNCPDCKSRVGLWSFITQPTLALPAPPSTTSTPQHHQQPCSGSAQGASGASGLPAPAATVALAGTIAGGSYAGGFGPGRSGVFGNPRAASAPVYGLQALAAPAQGAAAALTSQPSGQAAAATSHKRKQPVGEAEAGPASGAVVGTPGGDDGGSKRARTGAVAPPEQQWFDPLHTHRLWCPWVFTGTRPEPGPVSGGQASTSATPATPPPAAAQPAPVPRTKCGWMHLLESLSQDQHAAAGNTGAPAAAESGMATPQRATGPSSAGGGGGVEGGMEVDDEVQGSGGKAMDIGGVRDSILSTLRSF